MIITLLEAYKCHKKGSTIKVDDKDGQRLIKAKKAEKYKPNSSTEKEA